MQERVQNLNPEVAFYHLTRLRVEEVLPRLLSKTLDLGERAVVRVPSDEAVSLIDKTLWDYEDPLAWLPHAVAGSLGKHGRPEDQPIWISGRESPPENPNKAGFLFRIDGGCPTEELNSYRRVFDLFNGNDADLLEKARERWKKLRDENLCVLTYWRQNTAGEWSKERTALPKKEL